MLFVASMIWLLNSRRAINGAIYFKCLTYITLIFLLLSYVATLCSMSDDFAIGSIRFMVYLATTLPLLFLFLVILSFLFRAALAAMVTI